MEALTSEAAQRLELSPQTKGVVIRKIDPDSSAARSGLKPGDVVLQVNRKPVVSPSAFRNAMKSAGNDAVLLVSREGRTFFVTLQ